MFTKRSLITLASLAAAMVAHAGSIQVTGSSTDLAANTAGGLDASSSWQSSGYADAYSSYFGSAESSAASTENSYSADGTTLSGYTQATSVASAGKNGSTEAIAYGGHAVSFDLTVRSNVNLSLNMGLDTSLVQ